MVGKGGTAVKVWSFPLGGAVVLLTAGLVLTGCASKAGQGAPETPSSITTPSDTALTSPESSQSSTTAAAVDSLDELFEAADERLDCPDPSDGFFGEDYFFFLDNGEQLPGRQCGETIVMAWSQDRSLIQEAREMLASAGKPVPMVSTVEWFVADTTEAGEGGTGAPEHQARSKDLKRLAAELGADFTAG